MNFSGINLVSKTLAQTVYHQLKTQIYVVIDIRKQTFLSETFVLRMSIVMQSALSHTH
jgi:hypothetical protein